METITSQKALGIGCILALLKIVSPTTLMPYRIDAGLGGKLCMTHDVVFSVKVTGYPENGFVFCIGHCSTSGNRPCLSVFYDSVSRMCTGCNGLYDNGSALDVSQGTVYASSSGNTRLYQENCLPDHVCIEPHQECFTNTCICSPGYVYNPTSEVCVEGCEVYGATFQTYPNWPIPANNLYGLNVNVTECLNECISNALCLSVD